MHYLVQLRVEYIYVSPADKLLSGMGWHQEEHMTVKNQAM